MVIAAIPYDYPFSITQGDQTTRTIEYLVDREEFDFTPDDIEVEWWIICRGVTVTATIGNGKIVVNSDGNLVLTLLDSDTAALAGSGRHYLKIISPYVRTLLEGEVTIYDPIG